MVLAGRRLGLGVGVFTMTATWVDGGYLNGTAEATYGSGLLHVQAPWGYALSLVLGGLWFAPAMRRHGFTTLLDPFERRFGKNAAALLYIPALTGEVFWTAAVLMALGTTFGMLLACRLHVVDHPLGRGGHRLHDVGRVVVGRHHRRRAIVVLIVGMWIVVPFVAQASGGLEAAWSAYVEAFDGASTRVNWWAWTDSALLLVFGGSMARLLPARARVPRRSHGAVAVTPLGCLLPACGRAACAHRICARGTDWQARGLAAPTQRWCSPTRSCISSPGGLGRWPRSGRGGRHVVGRLLDPVGLVDGRVERVSPARAARLQFGAPDEGGQARGAGGWRLGHLMAIRVESVYTLWVLCSDLVYCVLFPSSCWCCGTAAPIAGAPMRAWPCRPSFACSPVSRCWVCPACYLCRRTGSA